MNYSEMSFDQLLTAAAAAEANEDLEALAAIDGEMFSRPEMDASIEAVVPAVEEGEREV